MRKFITAIILFVIISLTFSYIYLKIGSVGAADNYFNTHLRHKLASHPSLRRLLNLHFDGDAKEDYLGNKFSQIVLEVDAMNGLSLDYDVLEAIEEEIEAVTGKPVTIITSDSNIPYDPDVDLSDLEAIAQQYQNYKTPRSKAVIYLLVASKKPDEPTRIGSTLQETGLVLFYNVLKEFPIPDRNVVKKYSTATLLHEFGHQLGLPHNNIKNCLMNPQTEISNIDKEDQVLTGFCSYEKELIRNQ